MNDMADHKIEEIVGELADELSDAEEHDVQSLEGEQDSVEELIDDMAHDMEETEEKDQDQDQESNQENNHEQGHEEQNFSNMDAMRMLEAILFVSADPLTPQSMLERLPEGTDLNILLPELKEAYQGRGIELIQIDNKWAFRTTSDVEEALTIEKEVSKKLSKAALETLSIVAYHQPITRAEIENIRGVATHKGTLDILMELGWVKPGRRRETPGRPLTWMTTTNFLDHFQLESLMDLPGLDDLKASGLLDRRAAIETIPDTADLFDNPDEDAEEVLDHSDDDAYDEATYREIKASQRNSEAVDKETEEEE